MGINVDYYNAVIYITSPTTSVTIQQLVDSIRQAEDHPEALSFGWEAKSVVDGFCDAEGKVDVGSGYLSPTTITLPDNWYIEFWDGVGLGQVVGGNITGGASNRPVRAATSSADTVLQLGAERGIEVEGTIDVSGIEAMLKQIKNLFFIQGI